VAKNPDGPESTYASKVRRRIDADSQTFDPETKLMYVVSGGREAHTPYSYISIVMNSTIACC
jgi:hypothetical protein